VVVQGQQIPVLLQQPAKDPVRFKRGITDGGQTVITQIVDQFKCPESIKPGIHLAGKLIEALALPEGMLQRLSRVGLPEAIQQHLPVIDNIMIPGLMANGIIRKYPACQFNRLQLPDRWQALQPKLQ
jgi:hypothetical protein